MILLAAAVLEDSGMSPFSAEALIVAAWRKSPKEFGLKGWITEYPDANKVGAWLCGQKGLVAGKRWFEKVGQKLYSLTFSGRQQARRLLGQLPLRAAEQPVPVHLSAPLRSALTRLLDSEAFALYREGRFREITGALAFQFFGGGDEPEAQTAEVLRQVRVKAGGGDVFLADGRVAEGNDVWRLSEMHEALCNVFERQLKEEARKRKALVG